MNKNYVENPNFCPNCGAKDISARAGFEFEDGPPQVWQEVVCYKCDYEWRDIYTLTEWEPIERPVYETRPIIKMKASN